MAGPSKKKPCHYHRNSCARPRCYVLCTKVPRLEILSIALRVEIATAPLAIDYSFSEMEPTQDRGYLPSSIFADVCCSLMQATELGKQDSKWKRWKFTYTFVT
jgi:hypothetical protein